MLNRDENGARINWTEDRLVQEIADLEMLIAEQELLGDTELDQPQRLLLAKSLENRRRMLHALVGPGRTRALPVRVSRSS